MHKEIFDDGLIDRIHRHDLSGITNRVFTDSSDSYEAYKAACEEGDASRAEKCWSHQPKETVPVLTLTWVDHVLWLLNKLGIRSRS